MIALRGVVAFALVAGSVVVVAGCGGKQNSTMEPTVEQGDSMPRAMTAEARAEQLGQAVDDFAASRKGLTGHADAQSRKQLADALGKLSDVLVLLQGPDQDGRFRQQIRIIERGREQLTSDSATAPEPTVNAAIRAAQRSLSDMASAQFADDEQTKKLVDDLGPRLDALANERGPLHGFETARALDAAGAVVERMAEVSHQRMPKPQESPATQPAAAE